MSTVDVHHQMLIFVTATCCPIIILSNLVAIGTQFILQKPWAEPEPESPYPEGYDGQRFWYAGTCMNPICLLDVNKG
jgi:hypothetical protein